jgi:probable HAF family extracellular repeat protein
MTLAHSTRGGRHRIAATAAAAVVLTALAIVGSAPASVAPQVKVKSIQVGASASPRSQVPSFLLEHGRYTSFEAADPRVRLAALGINDRGEIAGEFITPTREYGFVRDKHGRISRIDVAGAAGVQVDRINNRGQIVGAYNETSPFLPDPNVGSRGFVLTRGRLTRIDVPEATSTVAHGINDRGHVVGVFEDDGGRDHGFFWRQGHFTSFDVPGATFTEPLAINNRRQIVGIYVDADGTVHGFLRSHGTYTTIDAPGAAYTIPLGINDRAQVVGGMSTDPTGLPVNGFVLWRGVDGPFTPIDVPGAPSTLPAAINNRGQIVGAYENPNPAPGAASTASRLAVPMPGLLARLHESRGAQ